MADIKKELNAIKNAVYGREVRGAIHDGIKKINEEVENTTDRQDSVEAQFQSVLDETTGKDVISAPEVTAARVGADGTQYSNLKQRLDSEHDKITAQLAQTELKIADINKKIEAVKVKDLQEPFYVCHRGAMNIFPENSLEAFQGCVNLGIPVIELDVQTLLDGSLGIMHDFTVDRTTDKTGNVKDFSAMGFKNLKINNLNGYKEVYAPLLEDVFLSLGKNAVYFIEAKDRVSMPKVVDLVKKHRLEEYVVAMSFFIDDLNSAISENIPTCFLTGGTNPNVSPELIKNRGIEYVGVSTSVSETYVQSLIQQDIKVLVYTVNQRYIRDKFLSLGVTGIISDDPFYVSEKIEPLNKDPYKNGVFYHGMVPSYTTNRGVFLEGNRWGFDQLTVPDTVRNFVLQGWAGELPQTFELNFDIKFHGGTYWCSTAICTPIDYFDDNQTNLSNGYHILFLVNGRIDIFKINDGVSTLLGQSSQQESISEGQTVPIRVSVTSTSITVERTDLGYSISVNDTEFRGGYLHFGRREAKWSFGNVSIT